jgi:hypothetical protein
MTSEWSGLWLAVLPVAAIVVVFAWIVWRKGRPFVAGQVFRASRLSAGNHLFPTQVLISPPLPRPPQRGCGDDENADRAVPERVLPACRNTVERGRQNVRT